MTTEMKIFASLLVFLFACGSSLFAQKVVTWKGGAPGRETQWQCPENWAGNRVPDAFSNVTIPDVSTSGMAYPVVTTEVEINALRLESNAALTIAPKGRLMVLSDVFVVNADKLIVNGELNVMNGMEQNNSTAINRNRKSH